MTFHDVGPEGDYPLWLRTLKGARGCYAIRDKKSRKVLYVGSSRNSLYRTITRHFQRWTRRKKWWSHQYGRGHDPGMVYDRAHCQVAIVVLPARVDHLETEARMIHSMRPRDNLVENPDGGEAVPF